MHEHEMSFDEQVQAHPNGKFPDDVFVLRELLDKALAERRGSADPVTLDLSGVGDLPFADLRMLLDVAQDGCAVRLVNVAPAVLSRIQDSGAGAILDASPVPTPIALDGWRMTGGGFTAESYFNEDGDRMLKLFRDFVPPSEAIGEKRCSRAVMAKGIPTPASGELVRVGNRVGLVYELLHGKRSIARAMADDPDHMEDFIARYAAAAKKLHAMPCDRVGFVSAHDRACAAITGSPLIDEKKKADVIRFLDGVAETGTCLQGDFQYGNSVFVGDQVLFIDLGMFAYGNPLYDLGFLYFTGHAGNAEYADMLYHNTPENLLKAWYLFVRNYFGVETESEVAEIDEMVRPFGGLCCMILGGGDPHAAEMLLPIIKRDLLDMV